MVITTRAGVIFRNRCFHATGVIPGGGIHKTLLSWQSSDHDVHGELAVYGRNVAGRTVAETMMDIF